MRFFSYLFYPRGLNPYTTFHYRAAASQPLLIYFNIDLRVQDVHSILITMKVQEAQGTLIKTGLELKEGFNVSREPRYLLCNSCLKVDIRKFDASCPLQQDMLVGDLVEDFYWSTPAVFLSFILCRPMHYRDQCLYQLEVDNHLLTILCFSELTKINTG